MNIFIFPYAAVKERSKIIIYGAGDVGRHYISQVIHSNYCDLLYVVDRNYDNINIPDVLVKPVDSIFETNEYDYVVIANNTLSDRNSIKKYLIENNIPEHKIIAEKPFYYSHAMRNNYGGQLWGDITYAQHADDLMILNIFMFLGIKKPTYIDIGAHHPYLLSNTALLYARGSRGINIEANPNLIKQFLLERPEDINLCIGVGVKEGIMPFYMVEEDSGRNSFSKEAVEFYMKKNPGTQIKQILDVQVLTLKQIIDKYSNGLFPDFLSIDVENLDYDILQSYDLTKNAPKVIDVEVHFSNEEDYVGDKMKELLFRQGYFHYCKMGGNFIFVKNEYKNRLY